MRTSTDSIVHAWELDGLIIEHYRYSAGPAGSVGAHVHDTHQICVSPDTSGEYAFGRGRVAVPARSVTFIPAGEKHAARDLMPRTCESSFWIFQIRPERWERLSGLDVRCGPTNESSRIATGPVYDRIGDLPARIASATTRLESESHLALLHAALTQPKLSCAIASPRKLTLVRDWLESAPADNPSLDALAAIAGLSPWHLCREFKKRFGVPPHGYLMQVRLRAAKSMLIDGRSLSETAHAVGFADQSHLNRVFRRAVGTTPSRYRCGSKIVQDHPGMMR